MLQDSDVIESVPRITSQWLAGFFDGEGSVIVQLAYDKYATAGVTLTQKDAKILALIMLKYDAGELQPYKGVNGAICHRLRLRGRTAEKLLRDIAPFCVVKRRQVERALEVINLLGSTSAESLEKRKTLCDEIKTLNREGNVSGY